MMFPPKRKKGTASKTKLSRLLKRRRGMVVGGNPWRKTVRKVPLTAMVNQMGTPRAMSPIKIKVPAMSIFCLL